MVARGFNWPSFILHLATVVGILITIASVIAFVQGRRDLGSTLMAAFLACFAIFKFMISARALRELGQIEKTGHDPRELFVSHGRFWLWVVMKNVAAAIALAAAIIILVHGPGHLR